MVSIYSQQDGMRKPREASVGYPSLKHILSYPYYGAVALSPPDDMGYSYHDRDSSSWLLVSWHIEPKVTR